MRWCRHPDFARGADAVLVRPSLGSAAFPIQAFSFTDDEAMTLDCTLKLLAAMPHAPSHVRVVSLAEVGMRSIAHVGAFRPPAQEALWPMFEQALR